MINLNRRGFALVHVLVSGVIVAFISAGLLRMTLMNSVGIDRATKGTANRQEAEALLNRAITYWNENDQKVCSDIPGFNCTGTPGICGCDCPSADVIPRIHARMVGSTLDGQCVIELISSDL